MFQSLVLLSCDGAISIAAITMSLVIVAFLVSVIIVLGVVQIILLAISICGFSMNLASSESTSRLSPS